MEDFREEIWRLVKEVQLVHQQRDKFILTSVDLLGRLGDLNAASNLGCTNDQFARLLGLSRNQYWKRMQVIRTIRFFPEIKPLFLKGILMLSHVVLIAPKITHANKEILLRAIIGKSKREIEKILSPQKSKKVAA